MIAPTANLLDAFRIDGRTAILTGAASGIGKATATLFAAAGARVVIADLDGAAARAAAEEIGDGALGLECDVSEEVAVSSMFARAIDHFGGRLDILVNNAAYRKKADTMTMPVAEWDVMHAVIARGTFLCLRTAVNVMRGQGSGAIVNISSVSARHPTIFSNMHYDSAKAGVDAITRAAAIEFAADGIRINSVQPGGTDTSGGRRISNGGDAGASPAVCGPMVQPGRMALGRLASPLDQAHAILFLASDAAAYITGQHLAVDGGFSVS